MVLAGDAGVELEARKARLGRLAGHGGVQGAGAGADLGSLDGDRAEGTAGQADDHARNAAVTDDGVGADAQHLDGNVGRQGLEEGFQVIGVSGQEQHLGRAADAEPGEGAEGLIQVNAAADGREVVAPSHSNLPPHPDKSRDPERRSKWSNLSPSGRLGPASAPLPTLWAGRGVT